MTPEQLLEQLNNSGLCDKADYFMVLIANLQQDFKIKHGKFFGASELSQINSMQEIFDEFGGEIDEETANSLYLEDNKIKIKQEVLGDGLSNGRIEFHEHKNDNGEDGFTVYFYFSAEDLDFVMSKGFGFGSKTIDLSIIQDEEF